MRLLYVLKDIVTGNNYFDDIGVLGEYYDRNIKVRLETVSGKAS